eukprot:ANDGO_05635.mRNA.1 AP-4 complex subunit epsilon
MSSGGNSHSKEFFELMKGVAEARSKQEEDVIISREVVQLKTKILDPKTAPRKMREYLIRALYCELLGSEASFSYIHAVKLCTAQILADKRVGYLAVALTLHPDHELMLLLVNTMQRDLASSNYLEVCAALTVVGKLANGDILPALIQPVIGLFSHSQSIVRKKAVMVLDSFFSLDPTVASTYDADIKKVLCDKDPSVMGAALCIVHDCAKQDPLMHKGLVSSLVSILKQIIDHRLPRDYDYHRIPAPWIQMRLLRTLALLGADDQTASRQMYEVLAEVLQRADSGTTIGYAVVFECVRTVTSIYPDKNLVAQCAGGVSRMLQSPSNNLKYAGITALTHIVRIDPNAAVHYQMQVIDCLEDKDETLQRKTLDLLIRITNASNIEAIMVRLQKFLKKTSDVFLRRDLVQKMCALAEDFAPTLRWYVETMNEILTTGGRLVPEKYAMSLIRIIAEGSEDDEESEELRKYAVETYYHMIDAESGIVLPDVSIRVCAWVLGEYAFLSDSVSSHDVSQRLCVMMDLPVSETSTRGWIVSALMKMFAQFNEYDSHTQEILERFRMSLSVDTQQRCYEFLNLVNRKQIVQDVLPADGSCEEIEVDENLSFLDSIVRRALQAGAKPYTPAEHRASSVLSSFAEEEDKRSNQLRFEAYNAPSRQRSVHLPQQIEEEEKPEEDEEEEKEPPAVASRRDGSHSATAASIFSSMPPVVSHQQPAAQSSSTAGSASSSGLRVDRAKRRWNLDDSDEENDRDVMSRSAVPAPKVPSASSNGDIFAHMSSPSSAAPLGVSHSAVAASVLEDLPSTMPLSAILSASEKKNLSSAPSPKVLSDKEKLAASLFGGSTAASSSKSSPSVPSKTSTSSNRSSAPSASAKLAPTRVSASGQASSVDMLLDFGAAPLAAAAPAASVPSASSRNSNDFNLDDLLVPSETPSNPRPVASPPLHSPSYSQDLYSSTAPALSPTSQKLVDPIADSSLVADAAVALFYSFLPAEGAPGSARVKLSAKNVRGIGLRSLVFELQPPTQTSIDYEIPASGRLVASKVTFGYVRTGDHVSLIIVLKAKSLSEIGSRFVGRVVYQDEAGFQGALNIALPLSHLIYVRPNVEIPSTAVYGKLWSQLSNEKKQSVHPSARYTTVQEAATLLGTRFNFKIVEVINNEFISSAVVRNDAGREVAGLLHAKVSPVSVLVTTRSQDTSVAEFLCSQVASVLQG